jgi:hypothetical protein
MTIPIRIPDPSALTQAERYALRNRVAGALRAATGDVGPIGVDLVVSDQE